jgi:NAD(P)-dependent dehydrogenase (short-subunit alcohol dehydrogenase family)
VHESREATITVRTAFIGGGAAGIGYAIAAHLAPTRRAIIAGRHADSLDAAAARSDRSGRSVADLDGQDTAAVPAGRAAALEEIAAAVGFLVSADAAYVNGTVVTVDGGRTETI